MKNVISIGINNVNGLHPLRAAASGAIEFDGWAKSQGYSTNLFTDDNDNQVRINDIFDSINNIIEQRSCEQLIIFFSGHGILQSPSQEIWLLSNAKNNPNESINLTGSIDYARTSGIPYIVFISDACRILPMELQLTGNGSVIFPICEDTEQECAIDILYGTRPGNPANEYSSTVNIKKFGLFTQSILEILNGEYTRLILNGHGGGYLLASYYDSNQLKLDLNYKSLSQGNWYITTIGIEYPLKSILNNKANSISITLNQSPDIRIQHQNTKPYISKFDDYTAKSLVLNSKKDIEFGKQFDSKNFEKIQNDLVFRLDNNENLNFRSARFIPQYLDSFSTNLEDKKNSSSLIKNAKKIFNSKGRESFETQTGFTIVGNKIEDIIVNEDKKERFYDNNTDQIRIYQDDSISSALIVLNNGHSIPIAILNGYIGTLVFDKNRLLTINYTPSKNNYKYQSFKENEKKIKFVRAFIASAANEGFDYKNTFKNEFNKDGRMRYDNAGSFLRREKSIDPSLGLYAVYAFMQAGKINDVKSVYNYMREESDKMLFDVAMLSGMLKVEYKRLAPFCPMLSLGWAYRNRFEEFLHPKLQEASSFLVPNLWTTFDVNGTEILKTLFKSNIIK